MLEKWKKSVIHLECATDSQNSIEYWKKYKHLYSLLEEGKITHDTFLKETSVGHRDIRFHGTALFMSHENRRYLLTARHVVWDSTHTQHRLDQLTQPDDSLTDDQRDLYSKLIKENAPNEIFNFICRVPSLDEIQDGETQLDFLMNLGAGSPQTGCYTFSNPELDLALISLDQRDTQFADNLIKSGFSPISSEHISEGPEYDGQELFAIGFPSATALLGILHRQPATRAWSSSAYSLPVSSFGRVAMSHPRLPFFWADISIYPGNSGGPVISKDRLIGIVSAQATLPIDDAPHVRTRIPFGNIIKSSYVHDLLAQQIQKDKFFQ